MTMQTDQTEYELFTYQGARLTVSHHSEPGKIDEIRIFGNRRGVASLANIFLWLYATTYEHEFLPVTALPFVQIEGIISFRVRVTNDDGDGDSGIVRKLDKGSQYEWELPEEDLKNVALQLHKLASNYVHEYDYFPSENARIVDARVHVRLLDVREYL